MSTDPTGTKGSFERVRYYHLKLGPKDWCTYFKGVCPIENNIEEMYCWICKHKKLLDIPDLLAERGRR